METLLGRYLEPEWFTTNRTEPNIGARSRWDGLYSNMFRSSPLLRSGGTPYVRSLEGKSNSSATAAVAAVALLDWCRRDSFTASAYNNLAFATAASRLHVLATVGCRHLPGYHAVGPFASGWWRPSANVRRISQLATRSPWRQCQPLDSHHCRRQHQPQSRPDIILSRSRARCSERSRSTRAAPAPAHSEYGDDRGVKDGPLSCCAEERTTWFTSSRNHEGSGDRLLANWPTALTADNPTNLTVAETYNLAGSWLGKHDVVDPHPSATELLAKAAGFRSPQEMLAERPMSAAARLSASEWDAFEELCRQRAEEHVPVQYLVGEWDFHGISLEMRPPILIPRPETEELVEMVLGWLRSEGLDAPGRSTGEGHEGLRFLDVGSGTGAIGLALLNALPDARCVAIDAQESAVQLSRRNAERTGLRERYECVHADVEVFDADSHHLDDSFDFIVSNPPYIPRRDMADLPADVAEHEDHAALDGGEDGLDIVRQIVRRCPRLLKRGGPRQLWMEVDTSHPEAMQHWLGLDMGGRAPPESARQGGQGQECDGSHGVTRFEWRSDLSRRPRFVRLTFAEEGAGLVVGVDGER